MLLANRKTLLVKYGDIENEVRGTLRAFGLKLSGRIASGRFEQRAMVRPMLIARAALRSTFTSSAARRGQPERTRSR